MPLRILFETDDIIIADKDRMIPVHGGKGINEEDTLIALIKEQIAGKTGIELSFLHPVHRIDQNTRGPVVMAKNTEISSQLKRFFSRGETFKTYHALLEGIFPAPLFVEADLNKSSHKKALVKNIKKLETEYPTRLYWLSNRDRNSQTISATFIKPIQIYEDSTLCEVEIWTGRYHQIRAVCEAVGFPVCGDTKYNHNPRNNYRRTVNKKYPDGQMLICKKLEIPALGICVESSFEIEV